MNAKNTYDTGQQQREYYSASAMKPAHRGAQSSASNPLGAQRRTITTHSAMDSNLQQIKSRHISSSSNAHVTKSGLFSKSQFQSNHQQEQRKSGDAQSF